MCSLLYLPVGTEFILINVDDKISHPPVMSLRNYILIEFGRIRVASPDSSPPSPQKRRLFRGFRLLRHLRGGLFQGQSIYCKTTSEVLTLGIVFFGLLND